MPNLRYPPTPPPSLPPPMPIGPPPTTTRTHPPPPLLTSSQSLFIDSFSATCALLRETNHSKQKGLYSITKTSPIQRKTTLNATNANYFSLINQNVTSTRIHIIKKVVLHVNVNMEIPNQWLRDKVDEFVYQFQSSCQYRAKEKNRTEQEIALLRKLDQVWNVYGVLNFLQALAEKPTIIQILEQEKEGLEQFTATDGYDSNGGSNVLTGLKCLQPIDITQLGVYASVIGCHIVTIYHYGFANLMLRRYVEGISEFSTILIYVYMTKQHRQKSPQYEHILKKNEKMYALLAICLSMCPQVKLVEETLNLQLKEKYGEKMLRMQRYDDEAFVLYDELLSYACPNLLLPRLPVMMSLLYSTIRSACLGVVLMSAHMIPRFLVDRKLEAFEESLKCLKKESIFVHRIWDHYMNKVLQTGIFHLCGTNRVSIICFGLAS